MNSNISRLTPDAEPCWAQSARARPAGAKSSCARAQLSKSWPLQWGPRRKRADGLSCMYTYNVCKKETTYKEFSGDLNSENKKWWQYRGSFTKYRGSY